MLNWLMRYEPAIEIVQQRSPQRVLDVGSGWHGLSWYWGGHVVQTDLAFEAEARPSDGVRSGTTSFLSASVCDLPFSDRSFDVVVCLDLFEHLEPALRGPAVAELARVGDCVVLGFPCGVGARRIDLLTRAAFRLLGIALPLWLREHLAISAHPDEQALRAAMPTAVHLTRLPGNVNRWLHLVMTLMESLHRTAGIPRRWEQRALERGVPRFVHRGATYRAVFLIEHSAAVANTEAG